MSVLRVGTGLAVGRSATASGRSGGPSYNYTNTQSLSFDGVDDYVELSTYTSDVYAVSMWFKPDTAITTSSTAETLFATSSLQIMFTGSVTGSVLNELLLFSNGYFRSAYTQASGTILPAWHHFVMNWNGSEYELWLNGTNVQNAETGTQALVTASTIRLGLRTTGASPFHGLISQFATWNDAGLTSGEIESLYNNGVPVAPDSVKSTEVQWLIEEGTGSTVADSTGTNDGTISGATWSTDVPSFNQISLDFDGVDDRMEIVGSQSAGTYDFLHNSKTFTVMGWYKLDDYTVSNSMALVGTNYTSSLIGFNFWLDTRNGGTGQNHALRCNIDDGTNSTSVYQEGVISDNDWHHYAVTGDGTTLKLYIDGSVQSSTASLPAATSSSAAYNLRVGHRAGIAGAPFPGLIDEVAIFSSALSAAQISAIYNIGLPDDLTSYSPFNWWRMGDQINGTTIPDQGSGSDDGTLSGPVISTNVPS